MDEATEPDDAVARRSDHPVYEYACHEGNKGLQGILAGARTDDAAATNDSVAEDSYPGDSGVESVIWSPQGVKTMLNWLGFVFGAGFLDIRRPLTFVSPI